MRVSSPAVTSGVLAALAPCLAYDGGVRRNQSELGFSLLSVLVAIGLAGMLSVILATTLKHSDNFKNHIAMGSEHTNLIGNIRATLNNPDACLKTLKEGAAANGSIDLAGGTQAVRIKNAGGI